MWYPALSFFAYLIQDQKALRWGSVFESMVSIAVMPAPLATLHQRVSDATYRNNLQ